MRNLGELPSLKEIWWLVIIVPLLCGAAVSRGAGGASVLKRVIGGVVCGGVVGVLSAAVSAILTYSGPTAINEMAINCVWRVFIFAILTAIGVLFAEIKLPEPKAG